MATPAEGRRGLRLPQRHRGADRHRAPAARVHGSRRLGLRPDAGAGKERRPLVARQFPAEFQRGNFQADRETKRFPSFIRQPSCSTGPPTFPPTPRSSPTATIAPSLTCSEFPCALERAPKAWSSHNETSKSNEACDPDYRGGARQPGFRGGAKRVRPHLGSGIGRGNFRRIRRFPPGTAQSGSRVARAGGGAHGYRDFHTHVPGGRAGGSDEFLFSPCRDCCRRSRRAENARCPSRSSR